MGEMTIAEAVKRLRLDHGEAGPTRWDVYRLILDARLDAVRRGRGWVLAPTCLEQIRKHYGLPEPVSAAA
jgi:hypothetical protein